MFIRDHSNEFLFHYWSISSSWIKWLTVDPSNRDTLYSKLWQLHLESTICSSSLHIAFFNITNNDAMCKDEEHIVPSWLVSKVNRSVQLFSHYISSFKRSRQFPQARRGWGHLIISILPGGRTRSAISHCSGVHIWRLFGHTSLSVCFWRLNSSIYSSNNWVVCVVDARCRIHCILHVCSACYIAGFVHCSY